MRKTWDTIKSCLHDEPGRRFLRAHHGCRSTERSFLTNLIFIGLGLVLIALGFLLGFVPGLPGIVLAVLGLALISTRFRWMAVALDWLEVKIRKLFHRHHPPRVENNR